MTTNSEKSSELNWQISFIKTLAWLFTFTVTIKNKRYIKLTIHHHVNVNFVGKTFAAEIFSKLMITLSQIRYCSPYTSFVFVFFQKKSKRQRLFYPELQKSIFMIILTLQGAFTAFIQCLH